MIALRVDSSSFIPGALHVGDPGFGVIGSNIPSTGVNGPSFLYSDISLPADANNAFMGRVTNISAGVTGFFAYEDGSFTASGSGTVTYTLYVNGISSGSAIISINSITPITGTISVVESNDTMVAIGAATGSTEYTLLVQIIPGIFVDPTGAAGLPGSVTTKSAPFINATNGICVIP